MPTGPCIGRLSQLTDKKVTSDKSERQYTIQVLDAAVDILESLVNEGAATATEVSERLGLHRNRVFRILKTLEYRGYVEADPQTRNYQLAIKFLHIGQHVQAQLGLRQAAGEVLRELAEKTGDVASLWVLSDTTAVCVDWDKGPHMLQLLPSIGRSLPLHVGAAPKVLLAYMPPDQRAQLLSQIELQAFTANTITDRDVLRHYLEEVRSQGFAVDEEDYEYGEHAFGAPVRDHTGRVVAALSVAVPNTRYDPVRRDRLIDYVVYAAREVSNNLGFVP